MERMGLEGTGLKGAEKSRQEMTGKRRRRRGKEPEELEEEDFVVQF